MKEESNNSISRYFIALVPPQPVFDDIVELKKYMAGNYNSKGALRSPPHITLQMPFMWPVKKDELLFETLTQFAGEQKKIEVELCNFSAFKPRVLFIDVVRKLDLQHLYDNLSYTLHRKLAIFNSTHKNNGFVPHITIAFRDLKREQFEKAWGEFSVKSFSANFTVQNICLLKHNKKEWELYKQFPFGNKTK